MLRFIVLITVILLLVIAACEGEVPGEKHAVVAPGLREIEDLPTPVMRFVGALNSSYRRGFFDPFEVQNLRAVDSIITVSDLAIREGQGHSWAVVETIGALTFRVIEPQPVLDAIAFNGDQRNPCVCVFFAGTEIPVGVGDPIPGTEWILGAVLVGPRLILVAPK